MIIGVLGNVTVMIYTIFLNKEKTATSYLVGNLALADLLVCLTLYPIWIVEFIRIILKIDIDQELFCKFSRATMWALVVLDCKTRVQPTQAFFAAWMSRGVHARGKRGETVTLVHAGVFVAWMSRGTPNNEVIAVMT